MPYVPWQPSIILGWGKEGEIHCWFLFPPLSWFGEMNEVACYGHFYRDWVRIGLLKAVLVLHLFHQWQPSQQSVKTLGQDKCPSYNSTFHHRGNCHGYSKKKGHYLLLQSWLSLMPVMREAVVVGEERLGNGAQSARFNSAE